MTQTTIDEYFLPHDIQRLEMYARNQVEYKLIMDLTSDLALLYFQSKMASANIDSLQKAILLGTGLQHKTIEKLSEEFNMPNNQVLAKFYDCLKKLTKYVDSVLERTIESTMVNESQLNTGENLVALDKSINEDLADDVRKLEKKQKKELARLKKENLDQYVIKGTDDEWKNALAKNKSSIVSIKRYLVRNMEKFTDILMILPFFLAARSALEKIMICLTRKTNILSKRRSQSMISGRNRSSEKISRTSTFCNMILQR